MNLTQALYSLCLANVMLCFRPLSHVDALCFWLSGINEILHFFVSCICKTTNIIENLLNIFTILNYIFTQEVRGKVRHDSILI